MNKYCVKHRPYFFKIHLTTLQTSEEVTRSDKLQLVSGFWPTKLHLDCNTFITEILFMKTFILQTPSPICHWPFKPVMMSPTNSLFTAVTLTKMLKI